MSKVPKSLQAILWSKNVSSLDIKKDKEYIIHHVLSYGSLENLGWLFRIYSKKGVERVFVEHPLPVYSRPSYNFAKGILLELRKHLNEKGYIKSFIHNS